MEFFLIWLFGGMALGAILGFILCAIVGIAMLIESAIPKKENGRVVKNIGFPVGDDRRYR